MSKILQECQEEGYDHPPHDLIPELMFFGELKQVELIFDSGRCLKMDVIRYEGKDWIMKMYPEARWFGTRKEMGR